MGARFVAVALIASVLWYAWHWRFMSLPAGTVALRIFAWSVLAGFAGKLVGVLLYRIRLSQEHGAPVATK
jgi:hypothetical protein